VSNATLEQSRPGGAQVLRTYYYDTNPLDSTGMFSQNALGRLIAVQYPQFATDVQMNDMYSYSQAGLPADKRLQVNQLVSYNDINNHLQHQTVTVNLDSTYTYNDEGQVTAMTYPSTIGVLKCVPPGASSALPSRGPIIEPFKELSLLLWAEKQTISRHSNRAPGSERMIILKVKPG
jgi:hypothetical protein